MKKFGATLVGIILAAHLTACTSKESREDDMTPPSEETAAVDSELEKVDGAPTDEASAGFVDDQLPEQALGEAPAPADGTAVADAGAAPADGELDLSSPSDATAPADGTATADAGAAATTEPELDLGAPPPETPVAEAPVETPAPTETLTAEAPVETPAETPVEEKKTEVAAAPKVSAPLQKVKETPYHEGGQLLNAYHVVRPGDTYKKMARTIYGDASRESDLKKANPDVRVPKVGNKIYYNSPTRPTDELAMKSSYADQGLSEEVYVAKEGDDLKKVGRELLGNKDGWKELWSTNPALESKDALAAGTEIHYFKGGGNAAAATVAKSDDLAAPAAPAVEEGAMPPMDAPPPPDMNTAANPLPPEPPSAELPPPPDMNQGAASGSMAMNEPPPPPPPEMAPPPPPPPVEMAPPPPPPPPMAKAPKMGPAGEGFTNDDMMMGLGAVGILAAGIAAIMVIRKRRQQKEMASAFGDTQVGA